MSNLKLYPYKMASRGAKALALSMQVKRVRKDGKPLRKDTLLINWGSSSINRQWKGGLLNSPYAVRNASNKLSTLQLLKANGVVTPEWTTDRVEAIKWLAEGKDIVARHTLTGHSGAGITIHSTEESVRSEPHAPLYTSYVKKEHEYRLHVFRDNVFFVQKKVRKKDIPDDKVNWKVRNHGNGFVYAHKDVEVSDEVKAIAIAAIKALNLDFGGVDMICTKRGKWFVLEVNTACGLEGETLKRYTEVFTKELLT